MKSFTTKLFTVSVLVLAGFAISGRSAYALAPIAKGRVVVAETMAPLSGVWVQWHEDDGNYRYTQTDSKGEFSYTSWNDRDATDKNAEFTTRIDTNLDGVPDATLSSTNNRGYGCGQNPHDFTAVVPAGWNGTFTTQAGKLFSNGSYTYDVGDILYQAGSVISCVCDNTQVTGEIAPGAQFTLTTQATTDDPGKNKVDTLSYAVSNNGLKVSDSGPLPVEELDNGLYQGNWSYTLPEDAFGEYNIKVSFACSAKTLSMLGAENNGDSPLKKLFSMSAKKINTLSKSGYQLAQGEESLKLGTFGPDQKQPQVDITCTDVNFKLNSE